jgi:F0F1-type ATP synthase assembly protein I|tara:strand:+ start:763 stop:897 length:135 start_codon:yes stop_codon:yes gene_type:complete
MELTTNQLIKIILGLLVVVLVVSALYFFGSNISDFFSNLSGGES